MKRWLATVTYRSQLGPVDVPHDIEELDEIADLVEAGPDWGTIEHITIKLQRVLTPGLIIEEAEEG